LRRGGCVSEKIDIRMDLEEMAKRLEDLERTVHMLFGDKAESYHKELLSKS